MKKTINSFVFALTVLMITFQNAFAATANLKFYTSETNPKTGETVELDLKVDGNKRTPYYTYVVNLEYDATKLKFEGVTYGEGWVGVEPEAKTDIEKGIVKRTAGFPNGADKLMTVMKYKFKALAPGEADVRITGEAALDQENKSADLQNKNISLNISGNPLAEEIAALQNQNITLNILGEDTFAATDEYKFKVEHVLENLRPTVATTTATVYDVNGQEVTKQVSKVKLQEKSNLIDFALHPDALVPGNYTITLESVFDGQSQNNRVSKNVVVTGKEVSSIPTDSENVFVNIANGVWNSVVNNWVAIVAVVAVLGILKYVSSKFRRYRRYDGR